MPRVTLQDPWGMNYRIDTMRTETLRAWFDEILPIVNYSLGERDVPPATIWVYPMFEGPEPHAPDWLADTRVIGQVEPFPARNGIDGMLEMASLRIKLEHELAAMNGPE